jgi:hypothetical protein
MERATRIKERLLETEAMIPEPAKQDPGGD